MNAHDNQEKRKSRPTSTLRLLMALGMGLLLGELGDLLAWNQQVNYWFYLCLLCPILLGVSACLIGGERGWQPKASIPNGMLAFIGFYLIFVVLGVCIHPLFGGPPPPVPNDCSPCWSFANDDLPSHILTIVGISIVFFPIGLSCVLITSSVPGLIHWLRNRSTSFQQPRGRKE